MRPKVLVLPQYRVVRVVEAFSFFRVLYTSYPSNSCSPCKSATSPVLPSEKVFYYAIIDDTIVIPITQTAYFGCNLWKVITWPTHKMKS